MAADYTPIIQKAAQEWNLDPTLLRALIEQESGYDPTLTSKAGAHGLTQLMPGTAQAMGVTDPSDPTQQIYGGAKYLAQALDTEKNPEDALRFYHGGPDWRNSYGKESAGYVPAITARYTKLAQAQQPAPGAAAPSNDPFTAALKGAQSASPAPGASGAEPAADPFTQALTEAQKATAPAAKPEVAAPVPSNTPDLPVSAGGSGGKSPEPTQAAPSSAPITNEYGITDDPQQFSNQPAASTFNADNVIHSAVEGAKEGFGAGPIGLSPQSQTALANAGVYNQPGQYNPLKAINRAVINPLAAGADLALRGGNTLFRGAQGAVAQTGAELGAPQLGRDLAALPEAFAGDAAAANPMRLQSEVPVNPLTAAHQDILDRQAAALQARTPTVPPANPLAVTVGAPSFVPPGSNIPAPPLRSLDDVVNALKALPDAPARPSFVPPETARPAAPVAPQPTVVPPALSDAPAAVTPGPQSVGAAASRDMSDPSLIGMTPAQVQAYRSTSEGQKLLEPQQPGISDPNVYVPGVTPNQAEIEQSVNTARELKALNVSAPEVSQEAREIADENNSARQKFFSNLAGSDVDVSNAIEARSAQAEKDLAAAFGNKKPTDAQPVVDTINGILKDPRDSENTAVQQYVKPLIARLTNADGTLKSDPEQLYGIREDIARMQSKAAKAETPTLDHVNGQLQDIKGALDNVIEQGASGYKQYLQNFSDASRPIDTMQALQGFENKLYGAQNRMEYGKVQTMMRNIVDSRSSPGLNPFKSIPDETMQKLWNLRDDLRRSASAQELARTPGGSDTTQTMSDVLKGVGKSAGNLAVHGALVTHLGPYANVLYHGAKNALNAGAEARAAKKQTARGLQILRPDPSQLRNPLQSE